MIKRKAYIKRSRKPIKRTGLRKLSQKDVPRLKRKLWSLLSPAIKAKDGNTCFSCGATELHGSGWHAGHLFPAGSHSLLRYYPMNIFSQCYKCNINLGGNGAQFAARFIEKYSKEEFDRLASLSRVSKKWLHYEIELLIAKLKIGIEHYAAFYDEAYCRA